ncbi:gas vesicle protein GvpO [Streptomyces sp. NPDC051217]|uniref:gas vesicle protein GvpO n=1 Tax=Streptomyces sp. NPDC051217 TaxID=3365644 RepID=UPI0037930DBF
MAEQRRTRTQRASSHGGRSAATAADPKGAARAAVEELEGLIGHHSEGVSAVRRTDDGWCAVVDVLEVPRIPDTTSLLAAYEVLLDHDGALVEYRRLRRYRRGSTDQ